MGALLEDCQNVESVLQEYSQATWKDLEFRGHTGLSSSTSCIGDAGIFTGALPGNPLCKCKLQLQQEVHMAA